jgi:prepilin-type N-terminal cleavage/methylation domain-containing protein
MGIIKKELPMNTKNQKGFTDQGFTLVELLVAMLITLVVMGAIFLTFKSQQDSYVIQDQITATQQNLRSAMYMLTRDIQMAGYYTNFDTDTYTRDWDDLDADNEVIRPLIYARNNVADGGGDNIKDNTDVIVIVKANIDDGGQLGPGEDATAGIITLTDRDLNNDGIDDLNNTGKKYGVLAKEDLSAAEFFEVDSAAGNITPPGGLTQNYDVGDWIFRADVIIYRIDEDATNPSLRMRNFGQDNGYQVVAENIDNLQFRYLLSDGTWTNNPAGQEPNVRAVEISLLARTANTNRGYTDTNTYNIGDNPNPTPNDAYRRKLLCSIVKTRNIGL